MTAAEQLSYPPGGWARAHSSSSKRWGFTVLANPRVLRAVTPTYDSSQHALNCTYIPRTATTQPRWMKLRPTAGACEGDRTVHQ